MPPNIPPPPLPPVRHRSVSESYEFDVDQAFKSVRDAGLFAKYQYEQNTHFDQQRRFSGKSGFCWTITKVPIIAPFIVPPPPPTMARSVSHPIDPMATWDTIHRSAQNNSSPEKLSHLFQVPDDLIMKGLSGLTIQEAKPISPIYQKTWPKDVNQANTGCNFDSGKCIVEHNWCYSVLGFPSPDSSPSFNEQLSSLSSLEDFNLSGLTQTSGSSKSFELTNLHYLSKVTTGQAWTKIYLVLTRQDDQKFPKLPSVSQFHCSRRKWNIRQLYPKSNLGSTKLSTPLQSWPGESVRHGAASLPRRDPVGCWRNRNGTCICSIRFVICFSIRLCFYSSH